MPRILLTFLSLLLVSQACGRLSPDNNQVERSAVSGDSGAVEAGDAEVGEDARVGKSDVVVDARAPAAANQAALVKPATPVFKLALIEPSENLSTALECMTKAVLRLPKGDSRTMWLQEAGQLLVEVDLDKALNLLRELEAGKQVDLMKGILIAACNISPEAAVQACETSGILKLQADAAIHQAALELTLAKPGCAAALAEKIETQLDRNLLYEDMSEKAGAVSQEKASWWIDRIQDPRSRTFATTRSLVAGVLAGSTSPELALEAASRLENNAGFQEPWMLVLQAVASRKPELALEQVGYITDLAKQSLIYLAVARELVKSGNYLRAINYTTRVLETCEQDHLYYEIAMGLSSQDPFRAAEVGDRIRAPYLRVQIQDRLRRMELKVKEGDERSLATSGRDDRILKRAEAMLSKSSGMAMRHCLEMEDRELSSHCIRLMASKLKSSPHLITPFLPLISDPGERSSLLADLAGTDLANQDRIRWLQRLDAALEGLDDQEARDSSLSALAHSTFITRREVFEEIIPRVKSTHLKRKLLRRTVSEWLQKDPTAALAARSLLEQDPDSLATWCNQAALDLLDREKTQAARKSQPAEAEPAQIGEALPDPAAEDPRHPEEPDLDHEPPPPPAEPSNEPDVALETN